MCKNDFQCNAHQGESPLIYSVKSNVLQSYVFRMNKKMREVTDSFLCNGSSQKEKKKKVI